MNKTTVAICGNKLFPNIDNLYWDVFLSHSPWWRHGNVFCVTGHLCGEFTGEFLAQKPVTRSLGVFFDLHQNKRLSKLWWGWWFETPSRPWWRHCNATRCIVCHCDYDGVMKNRTMSGGIEAQNIYILQNHKHSLWGIYERDSGLHPWIPIN